MDFVFDVALYTNGHLALENAIAALNLPEGGEVITTPFTFASTTHKETYIWGYKGILEQ